MNHFVSQTKHWCVKVVAFTKDQLNYGQKVIIAKYIQHTTIYLNSADQNLRKYDRHIRKVFIDMILETVREQNNTIHRKIKIKAILVKPVTSVYFPLNLTHRKLKLRLFVMCIF